MSNTRNNFSNADKPHLKLKVYQQVNIDIASGLLTGIFCSGVFNPWDRALYLSVKYNRRFISIANFKSPYQGFSQAVVQRAFLGSVYYIMQGELNCFMYPYLRKGLNEPAARFCIGLSAGCISGILTNSISAIKYHTWGQENRSFHTSLREMWTGGRFKPFFKGTTATTGRDMVFGSTYEVLRNLLHTSFTKAEDTHSNIKNPYLELMCNATASGVATLSSGPLNYVRNIQYATPPTIKPPTIRKALCDVWNESKNYNQKPFRRISFFQQQFRVGWGTARVAIGMAVGQKVFDVSRLQLGTLCSSDQNSLKTSK